MRKSGQITVFLSLVMLCVCSLVCGLVESARTAGAGWYIKQAADSAMDSVFSEYHREVWDQYRLFLLEYREAGELESSWLKYMEPYTEEHGWYPVVVQSACVNKISGITDDHGVHLKQEIQDYMKYGIWKSVTEETDTENLWKKLKEAESLHTVSEAYSGHAREAAGMEQALEAIWKSLNHQEECRTKAADRLAAQDGSGFRLEAKELKLEMKRLSGLIKTYEKKAEALAVHLAKTREKIKTQRETMSDSINDAVEEELTEYETYISENGEKRREIEAILPKTESNLSVIGRAVERSGEVEDEIESWDDGEDGDEPDGTALWRSVETVWSGVNVPELSFQTGLRDPEKQNLLEQVVQIAGLDLLTFVLPEGKPVSKGVVRMSGLPSVLHKEEILKDSFIERMLTDEYIGKFFTSFSSEEEKEIRYEQEYILGGKSTDEENLKYAAARILAVREGLNLVYILSDSQKREEARTVAAAITGVTGLAPLTGIVAFFVMTVWALGESAADLKTLLAGGRVPLIKTKETWKLDLDGLLALGEQGKLEDRDGSGDGKDYNGYLKLMLFIEPAERLYYRIMDMIQMNIAGKQPGFSMENCAYEAEIVGNGVGKHLFWVGADPQYTVEVHTDKAY